jgi:hypothetical protein
MSGLLATLPFLELEALELQRPAVLADGAYHVIRRAVREVRLNLQMDFDLRAREGGEMLDDLLRNLPGVPADPRGIEADGTMIAPQDFAGGVAA